MNINPKQYEIDGLKIEWGKNFSEVSTLLERFQKFKSYEGWSNIRCKCKNIFGLEATEMEVRAPFVDRPVLQVHYELSPMEPGFFQKIHSPFVKQLEKILGKSVEKKSIERHPGLKKEYMWSAVVYSVTWLFGDIRISLSVYGGTRNNESGPAAAGIFIDWIDEKEAAKPFREEMKKIEDTLAKNIEAGVSLKKYSLEQKQRPFRVVHFELRDPYIAEKDSELRASQMALYKRELIQTPKRIQSSLQSNEIALYMSPNTTNIFVSNKWDTIYLDSKDENAIIYCEVLPGRGPGGVELKLKELLLEDSKESKPLLNLVQEIETITGLKAQSTKRYDD
jgi:hypothetical protein